MTASSKLEKSSDDTNVNVNVTIDTNDTNKNTTRTRPIGLRKVDTNLPGHNNNYKYTTSTGNDNDNDDNKNKNNEKSKKAKDDHSKSNDKATANGDPVGGGGGGGGGGILRTKQTPHHKQKRGKSEHFTPWMMRLQNKWKWSSPKNKKGFKKGGIGIGSGSGSSSSSFGDHDPIAAIIEAQNTSKVRFDLTKNIIHSPPPPMPNNTVSATSTSTNTNTNTNTRTSKATSKSISISTSLSSTLAQLSFDDDVSSSSTTTPTTDYLNHEQNNPNNNYNTTTKGFMRRMMLRSSSGNRDDLHTLPPPHPPTSSSPTVLKATTKHSSKRGISQSSNADADADPDADADADVDVDANSQNPGVTFDEDPTIASSINDLIRKGKKAQYVTYQYPRASKYYLDAMSKLDAHSYPDQHKLRSITLALLNDTHHALRTLEHSADIVKMGLKHEEKEELLKALKMYTVAFRMRRDAMGKNHPSLPVLLNMLGAVQIKRGELREAMQIFELALYGRLKSDTMTVVGKTNASHGTMAVSMREMGTIHEMLGEDNDAIEMYHDSLECVLRRKQEEEEEEEGTSSRSFDTDSSNNSSSNKNEESSQCEICLISASEDSASSQDGALSRQPSESKDEEMEVYLEDKSFLGQRSASNLGAFYNTFFQDKKVILSKNVSVHVAMTLHNIANIHRKRRHYALALSTYEAALRGMKVALGKKHPNVAAVLGNIGNLHKDMKNFDLAFKIYQDVLKIESLNLGFGHPEVLVTMHNIAMIEKCRGNFKESKSLYREVLSIQHALKERSIKAAVTFSCLGDVEERDGDYKASIAAYKQALSIRTKYTDKLNPDLGRLLHKIGVLNGKCGNLRDANIYFAKAIRLYEFNCIKDARLVEVQRDRADILGKIALEMTISTLIVD